MAQILILNDIWRIHKSVLSLARISFSFFFFVIGVFDGSISFFAFVFIFVFVLGVFA